MIYHDIRYEIPHTSPKGYPPYMHEVSLMTNLLVVVEKSASREGCDQVSVIHLRVGEFSGVNIDALNFAFEVLRKGTVAESAELQCETIPLVISCKSCGTESRPDQFIFRCKNCESSEIEIISGREMEIDYILVDEESENADSARSGS